MTQVAHQKYTNRLPASKKQNIAFDALSRKSITQVAADHNVARNTVYAQKETAISAVNDAFTEKTEDEVIFYLPVTKALIAQMILGLHLICKASYRDIIYWFESCLGHHVSLGHIANTVDDANINAMLINDDYDLSPIKDAASDEIFHQGQPILATVDIPSRYCAGLSKQPTRCGTAWGNELLNLQKQGFAPIFSIIDGAKGLRSGYEEALPDTILLFDHFHVSKDANDLIRYLKNKRDSALTTALEVSKKMDKAKQQGQSQRMAAKLGKANAHYQHAEHMYQTIKTLLEWYQYDVLPFTSVAPAEREALYDFILAELGQFTAQERVRKMMTSMLNQRSHLLKVIYQLDETFQTIAEQYNLSNEFIWKIAHCARYDVNAPTYHSRSSELEQQIDENYDEIEDRVWEAINNLNRTSCMVENFNSRLKPFLDERKGFNDHRLALFQFILNHRPFARSEHKSHIGKSAAQLMTGREHPHWLEMLGFKRFSSVA